MKKTVDELWEEKEAELSEVLVAIEKLEEEVERTRWNKNNVHEHVNKIRELDELYIRRSKLREFLKEL